MGEIAFDDLQQQVASGQTESAIRQLLNLSKGASFFHTTIVGVSARLSRLKQQVASGTISHQDENLERAQIDQALLHILEELQTSQPRKKPVRVSLEDRLVIIKSGSQDIGSGLLVSNHGLVLSCYHNFYFPKSGAERTMKEIWVRENNSWKTVPYRENVVPVLSGSDREHLEQGDLYLVRIINWENDLGNLKITKNIKPEEPVRIVVWDGTLDQKYRVQPGKVLSLERATADHPERLRLTIPGYPGCSGGGVFNLQGALIGIINYIQENTNNEIIASLVRDPVLLDTIHKDV